MPESDIVSAVNAPPGVSVDWSGRLARRTRDRTDPGIGGILALANAQDIINFSGGFPDPSVFPVEQTRAIVDRLLEEDAAVALQYAPSEGIASTRDALAERLLQPGPVVDRQTVGQTLQHDGVLRVEVGDQP